MRELTLLFLYRIVSKSPGEILTSLFVWTVAHSLTVDLRGAGPLSWSPGSSVKRERRRQQVGFLVIPAPMQGLCDRTTGSEEGSRDVKGWEHF